MGNGFEQWRASIGLFKSKCIIKQRVMVNVSMAFIFTYMTYFLVWAFSCTFKLLSLVFNEMVCNLYFKIVLTFLLLKSGDIEMNQGPRLAIVQTVEIFFSKSNTSYYKEIILSNST